MEERYPKPEYYEDVINMFRYPKYCGGPNIFKKAIDYSTSSITITLMNCVGKSPKAVMYYPWTCTPEITGDKFKINKILYTPVLMKDKTRSWIRLTREIICR